MKTTMIKKVLITAIVLAMLSSCLFALCACGGTGSDEAEPTYFDTTKRFKFNYDKTSLMGYGGRGIVNALFEIAFDVENTYLEFTPDGQMHLQIRTQENLLGSKLDSIFNALEAFKIANLTKADVEKMLESFSVEAQIDDYVEPMFPGFKAKLREGDLDGALKLLQRSLGFYLYGLDYENDSVKELIDYVGKNMKLPATILDDIPDDTIITLTLDNSYCIKEGTGSDGVTHKGIYISEIANEPNTQSFGVSTVTTNKKGEMELVLRVEFMGMQLGFTEIVQAQE